MKNSYLKVIKDTLETTKNIIVLSMSDEGITQYGHEVIVIYVNNIENSLSFLEQNEPSLHIPIEGYNIHLIELGFLIKSIYHNPKSFLFIDYLKMQNDYIIKDEDNLYVEIIELINDNLPLLLVKSFILEEIDNISNINDTIQYMNTVSFSLLLNLCQYLIDNDIVDYDINFLTKYVGHRQDETTFYEISSDLNSFKQELDSQLECNKISENFIRKLDELYIDMQIIYSAN